jgi:hypothetical protein
MLERPLILIFGLMLLLLMIIVILGLTAHQLWGGDIKEFRTLSSSYYTMYSLFELHSVNAIDNIYSLYKFRGFWGYFYLIFYIVILDYTFMNLFAAIVFEQ